jgi:hypothetical protein
VRAGQPGGVICPDRGCPSLHRPPYIASVWTFVVLNWADRVRLGVHPVRSRTVGGDKSACGAGVSAATHGSSTASELAE